MIYEEAIYQLTNFEGTYETPSLEAIELAIKTLEKQIPKKPSIGTNVTTYDNWTLLPLTCPCCGKQVGTIEAYTKLRDIKEHFCSKCGQAIDWSE